MGAPRSRAWEAWAWRIQWGETARSMPARTAAWRTMRSTPSGFREPPRVREGKRGWSSPASPRNFSRFFQSEAGSWMDRVWSPLPKTVIWPPSPLACASRQHRPHSSLTRTAEPSQTVETTRWLTATGWAQWNQPVKVLKRRWLLAAEARRGNLVGDVRNVVACRQPPKLTDPDCLIPAGYEHTAWLTASVSYLLSSTM